MNRHTFEESPVHDKQMRRSIFSAKKTEKPLKQPDLDINMLESQSISNKYNGNNQKESNEVKYPPETSFFNPIQNINQKTINPLPQGPTPYSNIFVHNQKQPQNQTQVFFQPGAQVNVSPGQIIDNVSVKRTYVPVHYYNQIPLPIEVHNRNESVAANNDEAYEVLIKEYEKLFERLNLEKHKSDDLQETCEQLKNQLKKIGNSKYSLNISELSNQLIRIHEQSLWGIINHRKNSTKQRISQLLANSMRGSNLTVVEEQSWRYLI